MRRLLKLRTLLCLEIDTELGGFDDISISSSLNFILNRYAVLGCIQS